MLERQVLLQLDDVIDPSSMSPYRSEFPNVIDISSVLFNALQKLIPTLLAEDLKVPY